MAQVEQCTQCKNACPLDKVKCPAGEEFRDFVKKGGNPDEFVGKKKHGHGGPGGIPDSVEGLLRACGHTLHHGNGAVDVCKNLTEDEQEQLKALLKKVLSGLAE